MHQREEDLLKARLESEYIFLVKLNAQNKLDSIFGRADVHPLGFIRQEILSGNTDFPSVINFWPSFEKTNLDIHDHCYNFSSMVLHGTLRNVIFKKCNDGVGSKYEEYEYSAGSYKYTSDKVSEQTIYAKREVVFDVPSQHNYYLGAENMHHAYALNGMAITLQVRAPYKTKKATVWRSVNSNNKNPKTENLIIAECKQALTDALMLVTKVDKCLSSKTSRTSNN